MSTLRGQIVFMMSLRVGQGDKGLIMSQKVIIAEIIIDLGGVIDKINLVLNYPEQRLQLIEELDLKIELDLLRHKITVISDLKKQTEALLAFKSLCDSLGILDLELVQAYAVVG